MILHPNPVEWLQSNARYFSAEMNGYRRVPIGPYMSTLPFVQRGGKINDLGMGNGMLLKFLMMFSGQQLIPYGIDKKQSPLAQAAQEVLPEYAANFRKVSLEKYDFAEGPFDISITNPFYAHPNERELTERLIRNSSNGGRIIYRVHDDVLHHFEVETLTSVPSLQGFGLKEHRGNGLIIGIIDVP